MDIAEAYWRSVLCTRHCPIAPGKLSARALRVTTTGHVDKHCVAPTCFLLAWQVRNAAWVQVGAGSILLTPLQSVLDRSLLTYAVLTHPFSCTRVTAVTGFHSSAGICVKQPVPLRASLKRYIGCARGIDTHTLPHLVCGELHCQRCERRLPLARRTGSDKVRPVLS